MRQALLTTCPELAEGLPSWPASSSKVSLRRATFFSVVMSFFVRGWMCLQHHPNPGRERRGHTGHRYTRGLRPLPSRRPVWRNLSGQYRLSSYFSNFAHRQSLGRHSIPSLSLRGHASREQITNLKSNYPCLHTVGGGRLRSESVAAFRRNPHKVPRFSSPSPLHPVQRAMCRGIFAPAQPDFLATSVRDFLSGAYSRG